MHTEILYLILDYLYINRTTEPYTYNFFYSNSKKEIRYRRVSYSQQHKTQMQISDFLKYDNFLLHPFSILDFVPLSVFTFNKKKIQKDSKIHFLQVQVCAVLYTFCNRNIKKNSVDSSKLLFFQYYRKTSYMVFFFVNKYYFCNKQMPYFLNDFF